MSEVSTEQPVFVVTDEQAALLAQHAIHVQGGFSTADNERQRLTNDVVSRGATPPDDAFWARIKAEVDTALMAKARAAATTEDTLVVDNDLGDADPAALDTELIRRYKDLRAAEKAADAEKAAFKEEADALEQQLVEMFSEAGLQNLNIDGKTVYLKRTTFAQWQAGMDMDAKKQLLREAGAGDLITETISHQTIGAWVRELVDVDDAPGLPEVLKPHLDLGEKFAVGVRAAPAKSAAAKRAAARKS